MKKFAVNRDVLGLILFVTIGLPIFYFVVLPIALDIDVQWVAPQPKVQPLPTESATD